LGPAYELVVVGDFRNEETNSAPPLWQRRYLPRSVIAARLGNAVHRSAALEDLFDGKRSADGRPVLYVCQNFSCQEPVAGHAAIKSRLDELDQRKPH
jgi:uncharacterized protein YyaL (SSP411 family)